MRGGCELKKKKTEGEQSQGKGAKKNIHEWKKKSVTKTKEDKKRPVHDRFEDSPLVIESIGWALYSKVQGGWKVDRQAEAKSATNRVRTLF